MNNPTIDGVSRELLERLLTDACNENWSDLNELLHSPAACRCRRFGKDNPHWPCPVHSAQADQSQGDQHGPTAAMTEAGCQAYMEADGTIGIMHNSSMGHAYVAMRALDPELAALQSTIAQLQARVQELESGRGESVGWQFFDKGEWHTGLKVKDHRKNTEEAGYPVRDVYAAHPAPFAVVLPKREMFHGEMDGPEVAFNKGWNACLDATAALNTIHVGELDPAQRLALARGGETK